VCSHHISNVGRATPAASALGLVPLETCCCLRNPGTFNMPPNAGDGSHSPEPDFEHDLDNMTVEKIDRDSTEEESPQGSSGNVQPAKLNPKDPSRPRRKKARRACFACQRAHLTCGKNSALDSVSRSYKVSSHG